MYIFDTYFRCLRLSLVLNRAALPSSSFTKSSSQSQSKSSRGIAFDDSDDSDEVKRSQKMIKHKSF